MSKSRSKSYNKKKKSSAIYIYLGIFALLIIAVFSLQFFEKDNTLYGMPESKLNSATRELLTDENYQNIILPEALDEKVANKESFFVYMFSPTCSYCKQTTPQIMPIVNELGIELHQFNTLEFKNYQAKYNIEYTPTLVYFENGVEAARIVGGVSADSSTGSTLDDFRNFFETYSTNEG